ncbi:hypothetical protein LEN26_013786 [Aphanomyces euteiches]|nr:hypothetical protein LEN26_013786 [Aphanomyces euteiches]KAH9194852.1 hypothetical protein AeNC1_003184 [Aphanomyces euteiches]
MEDHGGRLGIVIEDIVAFLPPSGRSQCAATCKLWRGLLPKISPVARQPSARNIIDTIWRTGRSKKKKDNLPRHAAETLGYDLFFVVSGIRLSCLVDCVSLHPPKVLTLLSALRGLHPEFQHVHALVLGDDVFFIHRVRFVQAKLHDMTCQMRNLLLVDVTKVHADSRPQCFQDDGRMVSFLPSLVHALMGSNDNAKIYFLDDLMDDIAWLSSTAIAGLLLNYPVIYSFRDVHQSESNALAMQPLYVVHVETNDNSTGPRTLLRFSVPVALIPHASYLALIRARCRLQYVGCAVDVTTSTLSSVAL